MDPSSEKPPRIMGSEETKAYHQEAWQYQAVEAITSNDWKARNKKHVEEFSKLVDALLTAENEARFQDKIFRNLHFAEQDDRLYSISKPNEESFQWLWDSQRQGKGSFPDWLGDTAGQNVFWLTGIAQSTRDQNIC